MPAGEERVEGEGKSYSQECCEFVVPHSSLQSSNLTPSVSLQAHYSTGAVAQSLTSTVSAPVTENEAGG